MIYNVQDLFNLNLKEEKSIEDRAVIVDEAVADVTMAMVEGEENVVLDPFKPAEAIVVSYLIRNMNICMIYNVQDLLNINLKDQATIEEQATIVDQCIEDIANVVVEEGETVVFELPKPNEDMAVIVSWIIRIMNVSIYNMWRSGFIESESKGGRNCWRAFRNSRRGCSWHSYGSGRTGRNCYWGSKICWRISYYCKLTNLSFEYM